MYDLNLTDMTTGSLGRKHRKYVLCLFDPAVQLPNSCRRVKKDKR